MDKQHEIAIAYFVAFFTIAPSDEIVLLYPQRDLPDGTQDLVEALADPGEVRVGHSLSNRRVQEVAGDPAIATSLWRL